VVLSCSEGLDWGHEGFLHLSSLCPPPLYPYRLPPEHHGQKLESDWDHKDWNCAAGFLLDLCGCLPGSLYLCGEQCRLSRTGAESHPQEHPQEHGETVSINACFSCLPAAFAVLAGNCPDLNKCQYQTLEFSVTPGEDCTECMSCNGTVQKPPS